MLKSYPTQGRRNELIRQESTTIFLAHSNAHTIVVSLLVILFTVVSNLNVIACSSSRFQDAHGPGKNHGNHHHHGGSQERRHQRSVYLALESPIEQQSSRYTANASSWPSQRDYQTVLEQCCACDEAKYEMVFEGLWSKYTHPDDFPENYWLAYFSDIIGASHSNDFRMWAEGALASEGVRELAETGATKKLESEIKQVSSKTRTIIKARELRYPTLNSKTSAVFRTDRQHHLVSILSKLGPSPDWMVGVSGLELCQADCRWASQRTVNLFLWDAGTDAGDTFTAPDAPIKPQDRIRPYRRASAAQLSSQTNATLRSLFLMDASMGGAYNQEAAPADQSARATLEPAGDQSAGAMQTGNEFGRASNQAPIGASYYTGREQMKPFARLTVTRQRIYEKSCGASDSLATFSNPRSTFTNQANQQQHQQYATNHHGMQPASRADAMAYEPIKPPASYSDCRFSEWSDWSSCSSTCGKGIRTRTRSHIDDQAELTGCSKADLIEKEICLSECLANGTTCVTRDWSEWSRCSVDCGQGYRKRTRSPIGPMRAGCNKIELSESEQCTGACGQDEAAPPHCAVSEWSEWSECPVACGTGTKIRFRQLLRKQDAENCNVKLIQKQSCSGRPELCKQLSKDSRSMPDALGLRETHGQGTKINPNLPVIDCKLSNWSPWSTCSAMCGNGRRTRSRYVIQMPQNGGKPCDKKLTRTQRCKDLPLCPQEFNLSDGSSSRFIKYNLGGNSHLNHNIHQHHHKSTQTSKGDIHRTITTTTTTQASAMMDDEDESKFSRLLKSELGHLQFAGWTSTESYASDGLVAPTEMELIGSSSFQIKGGFIFPFNEQERQRSI